jgi:lantibiotic transport system permease protein
MFRAELMKLRRSSLWLVALVLPLLSVTTGASNYAFNGEALTAGWSSYWSQVTLFYGLLFFALAVSLLASSSWRMEHQGTNENLLLTTALKPVRLAAAKVAAISLPVATMQVVLATVAWLIGAAVLRLPGDLPPTLLISPIIVVLAALPLVALQSLLSMLLRSFAAPVAICLVGSAAGILSLTGHAPKALAYLVPQALATRSINLGSTAFADSGAVNTTEILNPVVPSLILTIIVVGFTALALRFWKRR